MVSLPEDASEGVRPRASLVASDRRSSTSVNCANKVVTEDDVLSSSDKK